MQNGTQMHAQSMAFTTFVLFQVFNAFNARVMKRSIFESNFFRNRMLWIALFGVVVLQILAVEWPPAQQIFRVESLSLRDWAVATTRCYRDACRHDLLPPDARNAAR